MSGKPDLQLTLTERKTDSVFEELVKPCLFERQVLPKLLQVSVQLAAGFPRKYCVSAKQKVLKINRFNRVVLFLCLLVSTACDYVVLRCTINHRKHGTHVTVQQLNCFGPFGLASFRMPGLFSSLFFFLGVV